MDTQGGLKGGVLVTLKILGSFLTIFTVLLYFDVGTRVGTWTEELSSIDEPAIVVFLIRIWGQYLLQAAYVQV
jgi:hypothetical protein